MQIELPYGREKIELELADDRVKGVLTSKVEEYVPDKSEKELVQEALCNPVGSPALAELARGREKIVIISSDHTRPVPSRITMPVLLEEIRKGNPAADITILVATGFHRPSTKRELRDKYGDRIVDEERIINHDSRNEDELVKIGTLPSGGELILNRRAVTADLLIAEGFIEPHFFAGYSGGRKSVLPGIASKDTVLANHCAEFIGDECARTGVLEGNPLHRDMLYAAGAVDLSFILNIVLNGDKNIIRAFAGHREKAHEKGCEFLSGLAGTGKRVADIVITTNGGYPLDQNIYQSVKGMTAAEATCRRDGVIIIAAECCDGHGGETFYNTFKNIDSAVGVMAQIEKRGRNETEPDQWESQVLARVLLKHRVIFVTELENKELVENMNMQWASDLDQALTMAEKIIDDKAATITVIPDGVGVIVE